MLTVSVNDSAGVRLSARPAGGTFSALTSQDGAPVRYSAPASAGVYILTATSVTDTARSAWYPVAVTDLAGVFTYHDDLPRDGANTQEYALTAANVTPATFGKLLVPGRWGHLRAAAVGRERHHRRRTHNVVFVATQHDSLFAFDADSPPASRSGRSV